MQHRRAKNVLTIVTLFWSMTLLFSLSFSLFIYLSSLVEIYSTFGKKLNFKCQVSRLSENVDIHFRSFQDLDNNTSYSLTKKGLKIEKKKRQRREESSEWNSNVESETKKKREEEEKNLRCTWKVQRGIQTRFHFSIFIHPLIFPLSIRSTWGYTYVCAGVGRERERGKKWTR